LAQPIAEDAEGPIFVAPERVGEVAGAPVYSSGRPRDCLIVFQAHDRPVWVPVSRGRYLEALVAGVREEIASADSAYREARAEAAADGPDGELEEAIRQLRAIDPKAAEELERRAAEMKREMERLRPDMEKEAGKAGAEMGKGLLEQVGKIEAELAAMGPAERASPAYVAGIDGSRISLLSSPGAEGSRALVAPNTRYFDAEAPFGQVQLVVVEMASVADHAPERTIIARLWRELDWGRFRRVVEEDPSVGG
jgi:hypothetical protein